MRISRKTVGGKIDVQQFQNLLGGVCERVVESAEFLSLLVEQPMPGGGAPSTIVQLAPGRPEWPVVLDAIAASWVTRIARATSVREAVRDAPGDEGAAVEAARDAVLRGALEPG